jgi:hypothetical protein
MMWPVMSTPVLLRVLCVRAPRPLLAVQLAALRHTACAITRKTLRTHAGCCRLLTADCCRPATVQLHPPHCTPHTAPPTQCAPAGCPPGFFGQAGASVEHCQPKTIFIVSASLGGAALLALGILGVKRRRMARRRAPFAGVGKIKGTAKKKVGGVGMSMNQRDEDGEDDSDYERIMSRERGRRPGAEKEKEKGKGGSKSRESTPSKASTKRERAPAPPPLPTNPTTSGSMSVHRGPSGKPEKKKETSSKREKTSSGKKQPLIDEDEFGLF